MILKDLFVTWFLRHHGDETGAALVEYALLLVFIVMAAIAAMVFLGNSTAVPINNVAGYMSNSS